MLLTLIMPTEGAVLKSIDMDSVDDRANRRCLLARLG